MVTGSNAAIARASFAWVARAASIAPRQVAGLTGHAIQVRRCGSHSAGTRGERGVDAIDSMMLALWDGPGCCTTRPDAAFNFRRVDQR